MKYNKDEIIDIYNNNKRDMRNVKRFSSYYPWNSIKHGQLYLFSIYITDIEFDGNDIKLYHYLYSCICSICRDIDLSMYTILDFFNIEKNIWILVTLNNFLDTIDIYILKKIPTNKLNKIIMYISL